MIVLRAFSGQATDEPRSSEHRSDIVVNYLEPSRRSVEQIRSEIALQNNRVGAAISIAFSGAYTQKAAGSSMTRRYN
jgi:hypothetical protein